jgi:uncharacterized LabA/DUF88 family protein
MPDSTQRIALFIDGAYLSKTSNALGFEVDFKRLLEEFADQGMLVRAGYYTAYEDQEHAPLRPLLDWLAHNGYSVIAKEVRSYANPGGRLKTKRPHIEMELAVDAMELSTQIDRMVFFSGNGELRHLVAAVQRRGVHVTVVGTLRAPTRIIADDLRRQADTFVELWDLRLKLERQSEDDQRRSTHVGYPVVVRKNGKR